MGRRPRIDIPVEAIAELCRRHHIRELSLFGSVLRDDFTDASNIDVVVEFEDGHIPGLRFVDIARELRELLGREVDVATPRSLSKYFAEKVLAERHVVYDAA